MKDGNGPAPAAALRGRVPPWRAFAALLLLLPPSAWGAGASLEAQVKAAFIYNFSKFITWSEPAGPLLTIGMIGSDPVADELERFAAGQSGGMGIAVMRLDPGSGDVAACRIVFIARSAEPALPAVLAALLGRSVLTVSDMPAFARRGGMIGFVIRDGRVRIEINPAAVNRAKLKLSAKLLELASIVNHEE